MMALLSGFLRICSHSQVISKNTTLFSSSSFLLHANLHFCYSSSATSNENPSPSPNPNPNASINKEDDHHHYVSAMSAFLVKGLGFSHSQIPKLQKMHSGLFRPTPNPLRRAQDVITLLNEYGFSDAQIRYLVSRQPRILSYRADENLRPKLEMLKSLGFTRDDLGHVISRGLEMLIIKDLDSSIRYYTSLYHGKAKLVKAVKVFPSLLGYNISKAESQIKFLKQCGIPEDWISHMVCIVPVVLHRSPDITRQRIQYFKNLGIAIKSKSQAIALARSLYFSMDKMDKNLKMLGMIGLRQAEVKEMVRKHPSVLFITSQKIKKIADYLVHIGVPLDTVLKNPVILGLSLENRIKPRHDVLMLLKASSQLKRDPSILQFFRMGESMFLQRFVNNSSERLKLLAILGKDINESSKVSKI